MNRNHFYTYTVGVRTVSDIELLDKKGRPTGEIIQGTTWPTSIVPHCANLHEVAGKLKLRLDDIRYEGKVIE